jgi:hydrogenase maturation factor
LCVTLPALVLGSTDDGKWKIKSVRGTTAQVISFVDSVKQGDYVTVFSGAIVDKLTKEAYDETLSIWEDMGGVMKKSGIPFAKGTIRNRVRRKNGSSSRGKRKRSL